MSSLSRLILILTVILACSPISLAQNSRATNNQSVPENNSSSWKEFSSTEGGFSALFPGTPKEERKQVPTPDGGNALMSTFIVRTMAEYGITYADYPWPIEATERANTFLDAVMYDGVKAFGGKLLEHKEISFDGHPGRVYRVEFAGGYNLRSKIFVVKNRLYILAATTYGTKAPAEVARSYENFAAKFFDSFRLLNPSQETLGEVDRLLRDGKIVVYGTSDSPGNTSGEVIEGKTISVPQPAYPPVARAARVTGKVEVQVIVDEEGKVIAAQARSGHPLLQAAAAAAARQARFTPPMLKGKNVNKAVKISGIITYTFTL